MSNTDQPAPPIRERSEREQILETALNLTCGDRNTSYGDPRDNLALAGALKDVFYKRAQRVLAPGEREAVDLIFTKLSRIAIGQSIHRDNYIDGAAYFAIAYECAIDQREKDKGWLKSQVEQFQDSSRPESGRVEPQDFRGKAGRGLARRTAPIAESEHQLIGAEQTEGAAVKTPSKSQAE